METNLARLPAVERHPQRQKIIDALLSGEPPKKIEKWVNPRISHVALWKYREKTLKPAIERAAARKLQETNDLLGRSLESTESLQSVVALARDISHGDALFERVNAKHVRYQRWFEKAEKVEDFQALAGIDRAETQALRFEAELTGRLTAGNQTLVQIVVNGTPAQPSTSDDKSLQEQVIDIDVTGRS